MRARAVASPLSTVPVPSSPFLLRTLRGHVLAGGGRGWFLPDHGDSWKPLGDLPLEQVACGLELDDGSVILAGTTADHAAVVTQLAEGKELELAREPGSALMTCAPTSDGLLLVWWGRGGTRSLAVDGHLPPRVIPVALPPDLKLGVRPLEDWTFVGDDMGTTTQHRIYTMKGGAFVVQATWQSSDPLRILAAAGRQILAVDARGELGVFALSGGSLYHLTTLGTVANTAVPVAALLVGRTRYFAIQDGRITVWQLEERLGHRQRHLQGGRDPRPGEQRSRPAAGQARPGLQHVPRARHPRPPTVVRPRLPVGEHHIRHRAALSL